MEEVNIDRRKIASLEVIEVYPPSVASEKEKGPLIFLFHGYGASAHDLFSLHQELQAPPGTSWYFPNGFVKVPLGPNIYGRAWFPIDVEALEKAMAEASYRDLSLKIPEELPEARERVVEMLEQVSKEKQVPYDKIIIGGFSQGAMLATDILLRSKEDFAKLVILSGTLLDQKEWSSLVSAKKSFSFFQSHGTEDPILPFLAAKELHSILSGAGHKGDFISFQGGHEIPAQVLSRLQSFLLS